MSPWLFNVLMDGVVRKVNARYKVFERRKLKVNVGKSKVMVCGISQRGEQLNLSLKEEVLEEIETFKYLRN